MNLTAQEWRSLALPIVILVVLASAGAGAIWWAKQALAVTTQRLAAAQATNTQARERLSRIAEEEREVREKLAVYEQMRALNILGPERRLEWADAMKRIQAERELIDLRFRVDRRKLLVSKPGKPAAVDFYASPMYFQLDLLHEGDLFAFLQDLRASGNAYYAIQGCRLSRTATPPGAATLAPRLRAECDIDLITVIDRAAKSDVAAKR